MPDSTSRAPPRRVDLPGMESLKLWPEDTARSPLIDMVETWDEADRLQQPPLLIRGALEAFLDQHGLGRGPVRAHRIGEGHSNATFLLVRDQLAAVLRRPPRPPYPQHAHNVLREARIQSALAGSAVPVPEILVTCEAEEVLGAPFYVMNHLTGHVITTQMPPELDNPDSRRRMVDGLVDSLVALHAVDPVQVRLQQMDRGSDFLQRQLTLFDELWIANRVRDIPAMSKARAWLHEHQPAQSASTITHGDYRLGNVMYEPNSSGAIAAILDWELCSIGDPLVDVGYLLSTFTERGDPDGPLLSLGEVLRQGGFPDRNYVAARYAEASGRSLDQLRWYVAFAFWRTAVGLEGFYKRAVAGATDDQFIHDLEVGIPQLADCAVATAFEGAFV